MSDNNVWLFDTTLRDGRQMRSVDFSRADEVTITGALDEIVIDYIEAGWPGANPTDDAFFGKPPKLKNAKLVSFGMTRCGGCSRANDPGLNAVIDADVELVDYKVRILDAGEGSGTGVITRVIIDFVRQMALCGAPLVSPPILLTHRLPHLVMAWPGSWTMTRLMVQSQRLHNG